MNLNNIVNRANNFAFIRVGTSANGNFGLNPCITFNPDGTADTNLNVFFTEGYVNSSGRLVATYVNTADRGRPFNSGGFEFNRFTGRIRYYETL